MGRKRKYPKTTDYYVYVHITPEKDIYVGMSKQQPSRRWNPLHYKRGSLQPYIERFGWDNIEHRVLFDNLTKHQAEVLEDWFIANATQDGFCINKQRSGGYRRDNPIEYDRKRNQTEKRKEYKHEYNQRPEVKERRREYDHKRHQTEEYKEWKREYDRQYRLKKKSLNLS